jgi:hypothetical protein
MVAIVIVAEVMQLRGALLRGYLKTSHPSGQERGIRARAGEG